jgi:putative addiction module component (TIGR02574 family)
VKVVDDFLLPRVLAQELECRLADHEANPGDVVPWSEVKASISKLLGG